MGRNWCALPAKSRDLQNPAPRRVPGHRVTQERLRQDIEESSARALLGSSNARRELKVHVRQDPAETASVPEATATPKSLAISPHKSASRKFNLTTSTIRRHGPRGV